MEQADQQTQSIQEAQQVGQASDDVIPQGSLLEKEGENKKLVKILTYFFVSIFLIAVGAFGFWFYQEKILKKPTRLLGLSPSSVSKKIPTSTSETIPIMSETEIRGKVVFIRDGDVFVINSDGSEEKRLTTYGANGMPVFSPNGEWIAFSSVPKEMKGKAGAPIPFNIWIIRPDGSGARKLSRESRLMGNIVWSPDSKKLAFSTASSIIVMDVESGVTQEFIKDAGPVGIVAASPTWVTPNTFVYMRKLPDSPDNAGIALVNIKEQTAEWLIEKPYIKNILSFSDGRKLLCRLEVEETIWQIDIASKAMEKLNLDVPNNIYFWNLKFSPTEDRLIGVVGFKSEGSSPPEQKLTFIIIDLESGDTSLVETGLKFWGGLDWSFNGSWLILNGIPIEEKIVTEGKITHSSLWKVNIQNQVKEKLAENARSSNWFFSNNRLN